MFLEYVCLIFQQKNNLMMNNQRLLDKKLISHFQQNLKPNSLYYKTRLNTLKNRAQLLGMDGYNIRKNSNQKEITLLKWTLPI